MSVVEGLEAENARLRAVLRETKAAAWDFKMAVYAMQAHLTARGIDLVDESSNLRFETPQLQIGVTHARLIDAIRNADELLGAPRSPGEMK